MARTLLGGQKAMQLLRQRRRAASRSPARAAAAQANSQSPARAAAASLPAAPASDQPVQQETRTSDADFTPEKPEVIDRVVVPLYMLGIVLYSVLLSFATGTKVWTGFVWWIVAMVVFQAWHWQAHRRIPFLPFNKSCFEYHNVHHYSTFPPWAYWGSGAAKQAHASQGGSDAVLSKWTNALPLHSSAAHEALLYLGAVIALAGARFVCGCTWPTVIGMFLFAVVFGTIGNHFHNIFHVKGHPLSKYLWFRELRCVHYLHHVGTARHNYSMVNPVFDKLLGAYYQDADALRAAESRKALQKLGKSEEKDASLPAGFEESSLVAALKTSPFARALLTGSTGVPVEACDIDKERTSAVSRGWPAVFIRVFLIAGGFWLFHRCNDLEKLMAGSSPSTSPRVDMVDKGHALTAGAYAYLSSPANRSTLGAVLALSVWTTDALGVVALLMSLLGKSLRPAIALLIMLVAKTVCAALVYLPAPVGSLWLQPSLSVLGSFAAGVIKSAASITVSLGLGGESAAFHGLLPSFINGFGGEHQHQQFFAGSVAIATFFAVEIARAGRAAWRLRLASLSEDNTFSRFLAHFLFAVTLAGAVALLGGQIAVALATKAHWTLDILAGILVGRYALVTAAKYAPAIDSFLP